jgi:hypothetical protein
MVRCRDWFVTPCTSRAKHGAQAKNHSGNKAPRMHNQHAYNLLLLQHTTLALYPSSAYSTRTRQRSA